MQRYDPPPFRRWNPSPSWLSTVFHPAKPGTTYAVRYGTDGEQFKAYFNHSEVWQRIKPETNPDGTRILGEDLTNTAQLYYLV